MILQYLSKDEFLVHGNRLSSFLAPQDSQVSADAVRHNTSSRISGVIAYFPVDRIFKKLLGEPITDARHKQRSS